MLINIGKNVWVWGITWSWPREKMAWWFWNKNRVYRLGPINLWLGAITE